VSQPAADRGSGRIKCGIGTGNREMSLHALGGEVACHDRHAAREGGLAPSVRSGPAPRGLPLYEVLAIRRLQRWQFIRATS
jgi:hypothetical protein